MSVQVTPNAWKWPPLWPYTPDYFDRPDETEDELAFASARMTPCLEGEARESLIAHYARFLTDDARVLELGEDGGDVVRFLSLFCSRRFLFFFVLLYRFVVGCCPSVLPPPFLSIGNPNIFSRSVLPYRYRYKNYDRYVAYCH